MPDRDDPELDRLRRRFGLTTGSESGNGGTALAPGRLNAQQPMPAGHRGVDKPGGRTLVEQTYGHGDTQAASPPPYTNSVFGRWSETRAVDVPHRAEMEKRFNRSFADVQAYVGERDLLAELGARAATSGNVIVFAEEFPEQSVVAHELTHVVQQSRAGTSTTADSTVAPEQAPAEVEAEANAALLEGGSEDGQRASVVLAGNVAPTAAIHLDRGSPKRRSANKVTTPVGPSAITSKPATCDRLKTGHFGRSGTVVDYFESESFGKLAA